MNNSVSNSICKESETCNRENQVKYLSANMYLGRIILIIIFMVICSNGTYAQLFETLKSTVESKTTISENPFPHDWFSLKCEKFNDPDMSNEKIKKMLMESSDFKKVGEILYLHITEIQTGQAPDEWWLYTDDYGNPKYKNSNRYIRVIVKGQDGKYYYSDTIPFHKDYLGNNKYSKPIKYSGTGFEETTFDEIQKYLKK